ncbi:MAG: UbiA family prenyltransferase, partial [Acidimicrobiia bacterium]
MAHASATARSTPQAEPAHDPTPGLTETGARLTRFFSMGITILYPLVGIATTTGRARVGDWTKLVILGVLFHIYADVANDVADLPIDGTDPRRGRDPIVRRQVSAPWGLWIALTPLPLMALLLFDQPIPVAATLATGVGLLGIYNIAGKTIPIPFVADFTQGAGWAALVFVGAEIGGGSTPTTWLAASFVVVFVAMVNGVHGAVRDVENDRLAGAKTTAVILGARIRGAGLLLPRSLVAYAGVLQAALAGILIGILVANSQRPGWSWRVAEFLTVVSVLMAVWQILMAFRYRTDLRAAMAAGTWHLVLTPVGLLMATVLALGPPLAAATVAAFVAPPLLYGRIVRHVGRQLPSTTLGEPSRVRRNTDARRSGLWRMTRIGVPITGAMLVLVGAHLGGGAGLSVIAAMVATGLTIAASNVFNDRCDVIADRINDRRRPLVVGTVTENEADKFVLGVSCA